MGIVSRPVLETRGARAKGARRISAGAVAPTGRTVAAVMRSLRVTLRFLHIAVVFLTTLAVYAWRRLRAGRLDRAGLEALRGTLLAATLEQLGATFIKFGQILSTRPDLLGPGYTDKLARLQDAVPPASFAEVETVLVSELPEEARARLAWIDPEPVAAASVAQVHRARLDTGESVALKVQRAEARAQIERDLAILGALARLAHHVPSVHLLSLPGAVASFGEALHGQLDFRLEAENNRRFAGNFADVPAVGVPRLYPALCTERVLAMEFIEGAKATDREKIGGDRKKLARVGGEAILKMVFLDGFVHADLHPGNILLTDDDRVVLIDLGMVTEIPPDLMKVWVGTFIALSQNDGATAARLFYGYAPTVGATRYADFERDVSAHLGRLHGKSLGEVEIGEAVSGMMNILRRHQVQVDPSFTVVHIALLVAEGLGKQLDPDIDLVPLALPYLAQAMMTASPARPPNREPPAA
jgi:ubiquinone biosynthesis protein